MPPTTLRLTLGLLAAAALALHAGPASAADDRYIVILEDGTSLHRHIAEQHADGNTISRTFNGALDGFVVRLTPAEATALRADPATAIVERDRPVTIDDAATAPSAPTGVVARRRNGALAVEWAVPFDGGSPITAFTATATAAGDVGPHTCSPPTPAERTCTIPGLVNGTAYSVTVTATNALGTSGESAAAIATPAPLTIVRDVVTPAWGVDRLDQPSAPLDGRIVEPAIGAGVTAYILDTGVRPDHVELAGRVAAGYTAFRSDGWGSGDCNGHGSHVAGTVAGTTVGVAPGATITPVRVLACDGTGSFATVIAGINWMIADHASGVPAVANLSLGGDYSAAVNAAIADATADGIAVVVSAGNLQQDACDASPASASSAITVGATDRLDRRAAFSNWGACVDLFAPGVDITSIDANAAAADEYTALSGTSMAAPHVAGAAAVLLSFGYTEADVAAGLLANALLNVVADPGPCSPDALLSLAAVETTPTPTGTPSVPRECPASEVSAETVRPAAKAVPATLTRIRAIFRTTRRSTRRGAYIVSARASHPGTATLTVTLPSKARRGRPVVLTYSVAVAAGPLRISTPLLRRGGRLRLVLVPADATLAAVTAAPAVTRVVRSRTRAGTAPAGP